MLLLDLHEAGVLIDQRARVESDAAVAKSRARAQRAREAAG